MLIKKKVNQIWVEIYQILTKWKNKMFPHKSHKNINKCLVPLLGRFSITSKSIPSRNLRFFFAFAHETLNNVDKI